MQYASQEEINNFLNTRLQLMGYSNPSFGSALGAQQISPRLIEQVSESIESSIDATLNLIYVLPIVSEPAILILRSIVCKLVVADVVPIHYFAALNPQQGGDGGFGGLLRSEGIKELERYTAGYGVYYSTTNAAARFGAAVQQAVPLPGVPLKPTSEVKRTLSPVEFYTVDRSPKPGDRDYINWGV